MKKTKQILYWLFASMISCLLLISSCNGPVVENQKIDRAFRTEFGYVPYNWTLFPNKVMSLSNTPQ